MASIARSTYKRSSSSLSSPLKAWVRYSSTERSPSTAYTTVTHPETPDDLPASVTSHIARAKKNILGVYARPPLVLERGKGAYVWDSQGRKYLDFTAGVAVNALGHADPEFANCMAQQAAVISHSSNVFYNPWATELAELLISLTKREGGLGFQKGSQADGGAKVFFANSGTEANEGALKIARKFGKDNWARSHNKSPDDPSCPKYRVVYFKNSFHGRSLGSLSATGTPKYQIPFAPLVPGFDMGKVNDIDSVELVNEDTCAVIVEPIQGEGGIFPADEKWLRELRKRCSEKGAILIFDEIQCGLYRTGNLWAHSTLPVECHPDIVTMAKPLANGFPIGAVMMRDAVAETMTAGTHGTTFGGSPLACALGHHVLSRLSAPAFGQSVLETGKLLRERLEPLPRWFPSIVASEGIRGRGLMLGIPFVNGTAPGELVRLARERGVLLLTAGLDAVRLVPSLNIGRDEVNLAADVIESVLGEMQRPSS